MEILFYVLKDIEPGRLTESLIFLFVLIWRIRPSLAKIEKRMVDVVEELARMNASMKAGFENGEKRFESIEGRVAILEKQKG